jgi:hypothetical protein
MTGMIPNTGTQSTLTINGTILQSNAYGTAGSIISPILLHAGDVITINIPSPQLLILEEN